MNWKEEFDKQFPVPSLPVTSLKSVPTVKIQQEVLDEYWRLLSPAAKHFISTEIIEKLIADIPDNANVRDPYDGDIDLSGKELKQRLRDKWLN